MAGHKNNNNNKTNTIQITDVLKQKGGVMRRKVVILPVWNTSGVFRLSLHTEHANMLAQTTNRITAFD